MLCRSGPKSRPVMLMVVLAGKLRALWLKVHELMSGPGGAAHRGHDSCATATVTCLSQLTISLNFFIGKARTVLLAGFALKTHGSFVNGFTPLRAFVAGFFFNFMLNAPASLNLPDDFSCSAATTIMPSTTLFTTEDF